MSACSAPSQTHTGHLEWTTYADTPDAKGYVSFTGPKTSDGLPILHTTRANGKGVPSHLFHFKNCTSNKSPSFINYDASKTPVGHIESADHPGKCITASKLPAEGSYGLFVLDDCYISDDSGQLFSTFVYTASPLTAHIAGLTVKFLGYSTSQKNHPTYGIKVSKKQYGEVLIERIEEESDSHDGLQFYNKLSGQ